jgi:hypothetical protein
MQKQPPKSGREADHRKARLAEQLRANLQNARHRRVRAAPVRQISVKRAAERQDG